MSTFIKNLVRSKIMQLTEQEIIHYSKEYNFTITLQQARDIVHFLRNNYLDPFDPNDRNKAFKQLALITSEETANKAERLFYELIRAYNLEYLFD